MAEIDADELERAIRRWTGADVPTGRERLKTVLDAARAHLASLRAPKGDLEEARAELGSFLVEKRGAYVFDIGRVGMVAGKPLIGQPWFCIVYMIDRRREGIRGVGPTEAAAIRAALSRARGEGT